RSVAVFGRREHKPDRLLTRFSLRPSAERRDIRTILEQRGRGTVSSATVRNDRFGQFRPACGTGDHQRDSVSPGFGWGRVRRVDEHYLHECAAVLPIDPNQYMETVGTWIQFSNQRHTGAKPTFAGSGDRSRDVPIQILRAGERGGFWSVCRPVAGSW